MILSGGLTYVKMLKLETSFYRTSRAEAGIYAKATIKSSAYKQIPDKEFFINPGDISERLGADVEAFHNLVKNPEQRRDLKMIPELYRVIRLLHIQGGCYHLTDKEEKH